jgi:xylulokinase
MTAAGTLIEWFAGLFRPFDTRSVDGDLFGQLTKEAEEYLASGVPVICLPHFRGSRTPYSDPLSRGAILGLAPQVTRGQLFLSVLQALCFEARLITEQLEKGTGGCPLSQVWLAGGGTQNELWVSLKADVLGRDVFLPLTSDIPALGAAMLAGIGAGLFADTAEAISGMLESPRVVHPDPTRSRKDDQLYKQIYHELYIATREVSHLLTALAE